MAAEKPSSKGQAWFCTTGLPSDVIIEVDDMTFHLHKFPLMSKSRKLHELITEQENSQETRKTARIKAPSEPDHNSDNDIAEKEEIQEEEEEEEDDDAHCHITLADFPGGSESFETAAKFCYGVKIDLSAANAAPLRCAGEYLEMTEEYSEDNLILKTERFLSQSVLKNIKLSIKTLTSCEALLPMAEDLGIAQRCIEAVATKAAASDPSLFGWPMNDGATKNNDEANPRRKFSNAARGGAAAATESWLDELGFLSLPFFKSLIFAMKALDVSGEIIESCLIHYAKKYIPGISRTNRKPPPPSSSSSGIAPTENDQRELLETVISNLPKEKASRSASNATRFLFGLLRTAYILNASEACKLTLEKKIGLQLEQATLDDLLIPSYSYLNETLYDVDCVERILSYFLERMEERYANRTEGEDENTSVRSAALMLVGKLIDGYLSEIASDANLKPEKFYELAVALPDHARLFDDGLYRAVDVYLKAHPWIPEAEREKICGVLDCQKLTLEACTHAAQNERLPLRAVVQVLFFEQLQLRHAIAGTLISADGAEAGRLSSHGGGDEDEEENENENERTPEARSTWIAAARENQVLRSDMDTMRTRVHELERECTNMKKAIEKIDKVGPPGHVEKAGWRAKFGCKFKTQVCDSHEPTVIHTRKPRAHRREQ
ncbi:BTB/POZ domain-containing protein At5g66560-like [Salvia miltiorrhiza]|uniref:BTB/POZ domain-containing protein At5g66560-like n=1 Tax=Salvia miltiorrhiza TaxID=226208 RepID=UPI0025ABCD3F|nr:BTB/POZ domain-containing protein At5g66560-like [Salvia miltiorrhiza]